MLNKTSWMTLSYAVLLVLSGCGGESSNGTQASTAAVADAQHPPASAPTSASAATTDQAYADPNTYSGNKTDSLPEVQAVEAAAVTHHKLKLANGTLHYTATEGHLTATDPTTGQQATIFYTAYTLDGVARRKRPVTFSYNGGPGGGVDGSSYGRLVTCATGHGRPRRAGPQYIAHDLSHGRQCREPA